MRQCSGAAKPSMASFHFGDDSVARQCSAVRLPEVCHTGCPAASGNWLFPCEDVLELYSRLIYVEISWLYIHIRHVDLIFFSKIQEPAYSVWKTSHWSPPRTRQRPATSWPYRPSMTWKRWRCDMGDFSRMRSKGSRFTLGVWGLRVCSLDVAFASATVRNRSQPFATDPREDRMAVPMGSSAEVVIFGGFRRVVASFRVAGVALRDIQTCSGTCRKSFCVAGAILLRRFQKMCCSFRGRRSTLDVSIVIFRGRRSTLDVSCCVFFANRIGRAASSGDKVQIPWQAWHFVTCAENWRKPRTKHRFWGCKFSRSKENS